MSCSLMPVLPFAAPFGRGTGEPLKTYAAWPVWSGSTTKDVAFQPMPKRAAVKLWHRARDFDRRTHKPGQHGGSVGHTALMVLHTLIFDFLNYTSGQLDPSYAAIARKAGVCQRTVATALAKLRGLGILNWVRRCAESRKDGRFVLEQQTNAYAVLPCSQWRGYTPPPEAPPPMPGTWGDHPPLPSVLAQAQADRRGGASFAAMVATIATDPTDPLAAAFARLGGAMVAANVQ